MNSTVMIPSRLLDMNMDDHEKTNSEDSNENRVVVKDNSNVENRDLYTYFSLLKTIKKDLIRGASVTDEDSESSEEEDAPNAKATQSAILFREHLGGLCNVLHQLTEVAQFLTTKYQQETGDFQTCPRPKPFTM
ncbi:mid1-interacting protein 1A-like [Saccoglossus kowalevskii]|uniref:Thyroid hormone-inducible hepatic protein-like n=1 Tax=Saccoglossus kowalevskii TaxID=10224 RepID=A0ABM0MMP5_SACKO|nr:PREDICTED: thyroid hormone-inducible hepatic protein-like [Saccoglossus kowalevskii]